MPRDLHRLAAPAVFCNNVRRSFRRHSPCRNVSRHRDRVWNDRECEYDDSRQRDRVCDDHEYEYDDYAAEIASYNRLRRGDRNASNSYSSTSRHMYESLPCYGESTSRIAPHSDSRYFPSYSEKDDRIRVAQHHASYISDNYSRASDSQLDDDDSQQKRHKRKRRHHHCHSQNKIQRCSENVSSSRPPRDTIAALKALADYGDTDHGVSSVSPEHYYVSPRKSKRKGSLERSITAVCNAGSEVIAKTEKTVTVNASLSSPNADCTRDNLSLGECTDDDDDDDASVNMHTMQKSPVTDHSLPHTEHSKHSGKSSSDLPISSSSDVSSSVSTKKLQCDNIPHVTENSSMQCRDKTSNSRIMNTTSLSDSKAHKEELPIKHDKSGSVHSEGQSVVRSKHSPVSKETAVLDDGSKKVQDAKCTMQHKSQSSQSTRNYRKKSSTGGEQRKTEDDTSLRRYKCHLFLQLR